MITETAMALTFQLYDASIETAHLLIHEAWEAGRITTDEAIKLADHHARVHAQLVQQIGAGQ